MITKVMNHVIPVYFGERYMGDVEFVRTAIITEIEEEINKSAIQTVIDKLSSNYEDDILFVYNPDIFLVDIIMSETSRNVENIEKLNVISTVGWCKGAIEIWKSLRKLRIGMELLR